MRFVIALIFMTTSVFAHEMVPTYPVWMPSYEAQGLMKTNMSLWNRRKDVGYYEIEVFSRDWKVAPFATQEKIVKVGYLERKLFTIYIRESDRDNVTYICTKSKLLSDNVKTSGVASRICSKIK